MLSAVVHELLIPYATAPVDDERAGALRLVYLQGQSWSLIQSHIRCLTLLAAISGSSKRARQLSSHNSAALESGDLMLNMLLPFCEFSQFLAGARLADCHNTRQTVKTYQMELPFWL